MELYQLSRFIFSFLAGVILSYVSLNGILLYRRNPKDNFLVYFVIATVFMALNMFLYSLTPFLDVGHELLAEISLGGSLVVIMIAIPFYFQYVYSIYQEVSWISKIYVV